MPWFENTSANVIVCHRGLGLDAGSSNTVLRQTTREAVCEGVFGAALDTARSTIFGRHPIRISSWEIPSFMRRSRENSVSFRRHGHVVGPESLRKRMFGCCRRKECCFDRKTGNAYFIAAWHKSIHGAKNKNGTPWCAVFVCRR